MNSIQRIHYGWFVISLLGTSCSSSNSKSAYLPTGITSPLSDYSMNKQNMLSNITPTDEPIPPIPTSKRATYLSWEDYFMSMALLSAQRSKDPYEPKGACIVDEHNRIVGLGYTGFPRSCSDDWLPWTASSSTLPQLHTQDPYVVHAEVNAILNKCSENVRNCRIFVPYFPCNECAKMIIQAGITHVIYRSEGPEDHVGLRASRILFTMAGITTRKYIPGQESTLVTFPQSIITHVNANEQPAPVDSQRPIHADNREETIRTMLWKEAMFTSSLPYNQKKRLDYLTWDDYFMAVAILSAQRSKDPNTQVGACLVDSNRCIVGIGYNGFPRVRP